MCRIAAGLKLHFNMTLEQWNEMFKAQNGCCAICGIHQSECWKRFAVDHDHKCCPGRGSCGKCVRSLLCQHCNQLLGMSRENPDILRNAANYVEHHAKSTSDN